MRRLSTVSEKQSGETAAVDYYEWDSSKTPSSHPPKTKNKKKNLMLPAKQPDSIYKNSNFSSQTTGVAASISLFVFVIV